ncbi:MAG: hypothetical protein O9340_01445 [Cyclobacteriaceae bacterium]|nr:hypothetical protein [Cyclobacteriaceae bacterium]
MEFFKNRNIIIASSHQKHKVIQPLVEGKLEAICIIPERYNTDRFGTFSGEIERDADAITTLRKKINTALDEFNVDVGIGSEGSFGPHPFLPLTPADEELVMLIDRKNNFEIGATYLTEETNYTQRIIHTIEELKQFADAVQFPSHALIAKTEEGIVIKKGIDNWHDLLQIATRQDLGRNALCVETDMRAMHNPTRMKAIEKATQLLMDKILTTCPNCDAPGFEVKEKIQGLSCSWCGTPTQLVKSLIRKCWRCQHTVIEEKIEKAPPQYCEVCNP